MTVTVITPTQGYTFDDVLWIQLKDQTRIHMKSDAGSIEIQSEDEPTICTPGKASLEVNI